MPPVVNQGRANISWALATVSGIEAWTHLLYGERCKLSMQELLDCCEKNPYGDVEKIVDAEMFCTNPPSEAFKWIEKNGIQLEEYKPKVLVVVNRKKKIISGSHVLVVKWNGAKVDARTKISENESDLLNALTKGPVVIILVN
ncbi:cathepsin L [Salvia divinorum]|uniref:Cathepsin L n=1 Tax=Salvia divinorum TaxID=28513 RepID=A0ABD1HGG8_SALDI